jgi:hypothetical protein
MEANESSLSQKEYAEIKASVIESLKEESNTPDFRLMEAKELLYEKLLSQKEYSKIEAAVGGSGGSGGYKGSNSGGSKSGKGPGYRFRF